METLFYGNENEQYVQSASYSCQQIKKFSFEKMIEAKNATGVTTRIEYNVLGRQSVRTNGRGNTVRNDYNSFNKLTLMTDSSGVKTSHAYDDLGNLRAVINSLNEVSLYEYDLHSNKIYSSGINYPVRYEYDSAERLISMTTYREEDVEEGDRTSWLYDDATEVLLTKTYADGCRLAYTYTDEGNLLTRTDARGNVTTYTYDGWGQVTSITYSDGIAAHYDYDVFGAVTRTASDTRVTRTDVATLNPFRFSSEYIDSALGMVYYNYRHYNPIEGIWNSRDILENKNLYSMISNRMNNENDYLGNAMIRGDVFFLGMIELDRISLLRARAKSHHIDMLATSPVAFTRPSFSINIGCICNLSTKKWIGSSSASLSLTIYL